GRGRPPPPGRGPLFVSSSCQSPPGLFCVPGDLRLERFDVVEDELVAEEGDELDLDPLAVKVAVEFEEMGLEQLLRRIEHRPDAETGDTVENAAGFEPSAHCIDAVARA